MIQTPQHLYIHWPFCSSKCHFCDFVAFEQHKDYQSAYHEALCKEIELYAKKCPPVHPISTIFLGGGTPSLYPLPFLQNLIQTLRNNFDITTIQEFTIETNPADIDEEKLDCWREVGISRISIGIQSLNDDVLLKLNRRQRYKDVERCMKIVPKYFDNISVDFILGLPNVSTDEWFLSMNRAMWWPIKHISIYFLTIHEKTPLYFKVNRGDVSLAPDELLVETYEHTVQFLANHDFERYEISNFAKKSFESIHNQAYWDRRPYQGFGVGASSFDGVSRKTNTKNLPTYLENAPNNDPVDISSIEKLTPQQELLELLMLGLRQKKGINLHHVVYLLGADKKNQLIHNIKSLIDAGLMQQEHETIRLTSRGMAMENAIIIRLLPA